MSLFGGSRKRSKRNEKKGLFNLSFLNNKTSRKYKKQRKSEKQRKSKKGGDPFSNLLLPTLFLGATKLASSRGKRSHKKRSYKKRN